MSATQKHNMILKTLENNLKNSFPSLKFEVNEKDQTITIENQHSYIGNIDFEADDEEIITYIGNFTHWHAGCYDESLNREEKQKQVINEVLDFLRDLLSDKIVMWGSHKDGGGFYYLDYDENEQDAPLNPSEVNKYVWSGKKIS